MSALVAPWEIEGLARPWQNLRAYLPHLTGPEQDATFSSDLHVFACRIYCDLRDACELSSAQLDLFAPVAELAFWDELCDALERIRFECEMDA